MKQSKKSSLLESLMNQIVGFALIYIAQLIYFNLMSIEVPTGKHIGLMIISTIISVTKHYVIRRYFQARITK